MRRVLVVIFTTLLITLGFSTAAWAQSGHFVGTPTCTDEGTIVVCTGKVAGLGSTTFQIQTDAVGIASVECTNPGGNVAPGQDTEVTTAGSFGPFTADRNGNFRFPTLTTGAPPNPSGAEACPNPQWTAEITDVTFDTPATISIIQGGQVVATTEVDIAP